MCYQHFSRVPEFVGFHMMTTGEYTSNIPSRPEVLAAMFFAAGMAFQRQVDSVNRLRMYRGAEDPLLPGENRRLLLEDVSPTFRSEASANTEMQEVQHYFVCDEHALDDWLVCSLISLRTARCTVFSRNFCNRISQYFSTGIFPWQCWEFDPLNALDFSTNTYFKLTLKVSVIIFFSG